MSKKDDKTTGGKDDPVVLPEPLPVNRSSVDTSTNATPPLVAVYRDGQEVSSSGNEAGSNKEASNGSKMHASGSLAAQGAAGSRDREGNFFERTSQFIRDVRIEMRRVTWPTAAEVKNTTIITLIAVIFFAFYLFIIDKGIAFFITQLERFVEWLL